jgi:hypothetical protein
VSSISGCVKSRQKPLVLIFDPLDDFSFSAPVYVKYDSRSRSLEVITRGISEGAKQRVWCLYLIGWMCILERVSLIRVARAIPMVHDPTGTFRRNFSSHSILLQSSTSIFSSSK